MSREGEASRCLHDLRFGYDKLVADLSVCLRDLRMIAVVVYLEGFHYLGQALPQPPPWWLGLWSDCFALLD